VENWKPKTFRKEMIGKRDALRRFPKTNNVEAEVTSDGTRWDIQGLNSNIANLQPLLAFTTGLVLTFCQVTSYF